MKAGRSARWWSTACLARAAPVSAGQLRQRRHGGSHRRAGGCGRRDGGRRRVRRPARGRAISDAGGTMIVTADHGNLDMMWEVDARDRRGQAGRRRHAGGQDQPHPEPGSVAAGGDRCRTCSRPNPEVERPGLGNIAATILLLLGFQAPEDYLPPLIRRPRSAEPGRLTPCSRRLLESTVMAAPTIPFLEPIETSARGDRRARSRSPGRTARLASRLREATARAVGRRSNGSFRI